MLPVRDLVVFPHMVLPLFVGREMSIKAIDEALAGNRFVVLVAQRALDVENPQPKDIYAVGTVGMIMRMLKLPDGRIKILVQALAKAKVVDYVQSAPFYVVRIEKLPDPAMPEIGLELEALMRTVKEQLEKIIGFGKLLLPEIMVVIENLDEPGRLADMIASNLGLKVDLAQEVLELADPVARLRRVNEILNKEIELLSMQQKIQAEAKGEMDKSQREYSCANSSRPSKKNWATSTSGWRRSTKSRSASSRRRCPRRSSRRRTSSSSASRRCTPTRRSPRRSGPTWNGWSSCRGARSPRTTWTSPPPSGC
jgi:ATP-dependent Lon protease